MEFSKKNSPIKKFGNGIIFLGSILFSLFLVEFILGLQIIKKGKTFPKPPPFIQKYRANPHVLLDGSILYTGLANREFRTFGYKVRNNRWGFREKEFTPKKDKKKFRILVFGDSFTFGVGIDDNHRYSNSLEEMLKINNINSEVLNFGMGGYATDQEHDLMKMILENVECDLVIIGFCCDDLQMTTQEKLKTFTNVEKISKEDRARILEQNYKLTFNNFRNISTIPPIEPKAFSKVRKWYQKTNIYKFFEIRTNINLEEKIPNQARWKYALNEFKGMKSLTQKHKLPPPIVVLLNYGFIDGRKNNFNNPKGELAQTIHFYQFVGKELKKEGFHVVDTLPLFKKYSGMSMATSEWEHHPNYLGHYIYAESIGKYLLSNNLIPNN